MRQVIVLLGATGVGKTALSIALAKHFGTSIISADSRQFYKGLEIGTAAPTSEQLKEIEHHLVGMLKVEDYYNASEFENNALKIIEKILQQNDIVIVTGGSMMYIDALCNGIDNIPTVDEELRKELYDLYNQIGLDPIKSRLKILDPDFYNQVDLKNYKRVIHALEICLMTGKPYSSFRTKIKKNRPFKILKIGLMRERLDLYDRINKRVDEMIKQGLIEEARRHYGQRHLNSLNTVGYKELFKHFEGEWTLEFAIEKIKQNTRIYSRKQMTWFKRDNEIHWINLSATTEQSALQEIITLTNIN